jgi:hypothetical protein
MVLSVAPPPLARTPDCQGHHATALTAAWNKKLSHFFKASSKM